MTRGNLFADIRQQSHVKFPDTITVNGFPACREEVPHGNDGNVIISGAFEFGSFLFCNTANIRVVVFQSFNELGIFIVDGFSRLDRADILIA